MGVVAVSCMSTNCVCMCIEKKKETPSVGRWNGGGMIWLSV